MGASLTQPVVSRMFVTVVNQRLVDGSLKCRWGAGDDRSFVPPEREEKAGGHEANGSNREGFSSEKYLQTQWVISDRMQIVKSESSFGYGKGTIGISDCV
jgi:hypothetical protein